MVPRHRLLFSLVLSTALAGSALAQPSRTKHEPHKPPPPGSPAQYNTAAAPHTLAGALASTYANEPALLAERAKLRATDENVPAALSGWRPTVVLAGTAGYGNGVTRSYSPFLGHYSLSSERDLATGQATLTQPIYNGGRTQANVNRSKNQVMAERAALMVQEQTSFQNTVNAYVGVIQAQQIVQLDKNNVEVLSRQLQATRDRFRVGEITRTDVAQAEAALSGAESTLESDQGSLQSARATFVQTVGYVPPADLVEPQPLQLPVRSEQQASAIAAANNPNVVEAKFNNAAAKDAVDVAFSQLMPQVSLQAQTFAQENSGGRSSQATGYQVVAQLSVPLYQGGSEYAAVRQAKQTAQQTDRLITYQERSAVQAAVQAWDTYVAAKAAAVSSRAAIRANEIALQGVEREAIVGSRTTLDVLNAQQALLQSRTTLVANLAALVKASYSVAGAIGRLTARDLRLNVPLYDDTAYYKAVKDRWFGLGDYATGQPNR
ncbi:MAG TPA: TolC family outer membrane protein [Acetobacteraceae bacterium]|nr:TolC family outer membrane protein [Acetobacteraceae bacterium]